MKIKFTALSIKNLKPAARSVEYFDTGREKGDGALGIRVSPKNKRTWFVMYKLHGKIQRYTLGIYPDLSLKEARKAATNTMASVNAGHDPQGEKVEYRQSETFSDLWRAYLEHPDTRKKAASTMLEEHRKYEKILKPAFGDVKVVDITRKDLNRVIKSVAATSPVSANRLFALLSVMFNRIALDEEWIQSNPMPRKRPLKEETPRDRVLSKNEIKLLWPAFDSAAPNMRDIFKIILLSGQRPNEVASLEWSEVDFDSLIWTIPRDKTKSKKQAHSVPLSPQMAAILEKRRGNGSKYVFPSNHGRKAGHTKHTHKARRKLIKDLEMEKWGAHDLRRTARDIMAQLKVPPYVGERVIGHAVGKMEKTYTVHDYADEKRVALYKLGREIDRIIGQKEPTKIVPLRKKSA